MCAILCHSASSIMIAYYAMLNAYSVIQDDIEPTMARRSFVTLRMTLLAMLRSECRCTEPTYPPQK